MRSGIAAALIAALGAHGLPAAAQSVPRSAADGIYTREQAVRGAAVYARACAECHSASLRDQGEAPPLAGKDFLEQWQSYSVGDLFERIRQTMPQTSPNSLSAQEYADVLARMLEVNGYPAGATALEGRLELLRQIRFTPAPPSK